MCLRFLRGDDNSRRRNDGAPTGPVSITANSGGQHSQVSCGSGCVRGVDMTVVAMDTVPPRHRPASHIMSAELTSGENKPLETWNTETRTRLSPNSIHNDFAYNKFKASPYGIVAEMGATETIPLPRSRTSSARGWDHHSEGDRRERAQLQPEAGRRGQELLSRGPSSGGVLSSSTTWRGMFFVSQYCENVAFGSRTARFFRKHAQRSAVGSGSGRRGRAWPKSQLGRFEPLGLRSGTVDDLDGPRMAAQGGFRSFVAPAANGEVA